MAFAEVARFRPMRRDIVLPLSGAPVHFYQMSDQASLVPRGVPKLGRICMCLRQGHLSVQSGSTLAEPIPLFRAPICRRRPLDFGMFHAMTDHLRLFILIAAAWVNTDQQKIIDYLLEEIRVYQKRFNGLRLPTAR